MREVIPYEIELVLVLKEVHDSSCYATLAHTRWHNEQDTRLLLAEFGVSAEVPASSVFLLLGVSSTSTCSTSDLRLLALFSLVITLAFFTLTTFCV